MKFRWEFAKVTTIAVFVACGAAAQAVQPELAGRDSIGGTPSQSVAAVVLDFTV